MGDDFLMTIRNRKGDAFGSEPGKVRYLAVPPSASLGAPRHEIRRTDWFSRVLADAAPGSQGQARQPGDVLIHIHGFNNAQEVVLDRHRSLRRHLTAEGYQGALVSFDWPCDDRALNYLEDRVDAKQTALRLVTDGLLPLVSFMQTDCLVGVHVLAHSMGAFVLREACDDADDRRSLAATGWAFNQVMLCGADVSAHSMGPTEVSASLYRHCARLTNYSNPYDGVLSISNVKRIGVAPRVGRVGLPEDAPPRGVNVDTGAHYRATYMDRPQALTHAHSWYFDDRVFLRDVLHTMRGSFDRHVIPTRHEVEGQLHLRA